MRKTTARLLYTAVISAVVAPIVGALLVPSSFNYAEAQSGGQYVRKNNPVMRQSMQLAVVTLVDGGEDAGNQYSQSDPDTYKYPGRVVFTDDQYVAVWRDGGVTTRGYYKLAFASGIAPSATPEWEFDGTDSIYPVRGTSTLVGIGTESPIDRLHVQTTDNTLAAADLVPTNDMIIEGEDGALSLVGNNTGSYNSSLNMVEVNAGTLNSVWTIAREVGATGDLTFWSGANATFSSNTEHMRLTTDGRLGIGTDPRRRLEVYGTDSHETAGPHLWFTTTADDYPLLTVLPWSHDNVSISFDAYFASGNWTSAHAGSNFTIYKELDALLFRYSSGNAQGATFTWGNGIVLASTGNVGIGDSDPAYLIETAAGTMRMPTTSSIYLGDAATTDHLRMHHISNNSYIDYGTGGLFIRPDGGVDLALLDASANFYFSSSAARDFIIGGSQSTTGRLNLYTNTNASNGAGIELHGNTYPGREGDIWHITGLVGDHAFLAYNGGAYTEIMRIEGDDQQVGIGTADPWTKLHVYNAASGNTPAAGTVITAENNTTAYFSLLTPDANERGILFGEVSSNAAGAFLYNTSSVADGFEFRVNGNTHRMTIDSGGNVAIGAGVYSPGTILDIVRSQNAGTYVEVDNQTNLGNAYAGYRLTTSGGDALIFKPADAYATTAIAGDLVLYNVDGGQDIVMYTAAGEHSRFEGTNQRLGVGTAGETIDEFIHVYNAGPASIKIEADASDSDPTAKFEHDTVYWTIGMDNDSANYPFIISDTTNLSNPHLTVMQTGYVGIGHGDASPPEAPLHVSGGNVRAPNADAIAILEQSGAGSLQFLTTGQQAIRFGDASNDTAGSIFYSHTSNLLGFVTNGTTEWYIMSGGTFRPPIDGGADIGSGAIPARPQDLYLSNDIKDVRNIHADQCSAPTCTLGNFPSGSSCTVATASRTMRGQVEIYVNGAGSPTMGYTSYVCIQYNGSCEFDASTGEDGSRVPIVTPIWRRNYPTSGSDCSQIVGGSIYLFAPNYGGGSTVFPTPYRAYDEDGFCFQLRLSSWPTVGEYCQVVWQSMG